MLMVKLRGHPYFKPALPGLMHKVTYSKYPHHDRPPFWRDHILNVIYFTQKWDYCIPNGNWKELYTIKKSVSDLPMPVSLIKKWMVSKLLSLTLTPTLPHPFSTLTGSGSAPTITCVAMAIKSWPSVLETKGNDLDTRTLHSMTFRSLSCNELWE